MKKKIKKYVKVIISIVLICAFVIPSYAKLSISDGSSLVTKAEFDSLLADFNSQMTNMESRIGSNIESKVSAYLEKNGIWSATVQSEFVGQSITINSVNSFIKEIPVGTTISQPIWEINGIFTKTGLVFMSISEEANTPNKGAHYQPFVRYNCEGIQYCTITFLMELFQNLTPKISKTFLIFDSSTIGLGTFASIPSSTTTMLGFVEKNKPTKFALTQYAINRGTQVATIDTMWTFFDVNGYMKYTIDRCEIY